MKSKKLTIVIVILICVAIVFGAYYYKTKMIQKNNTQVTKETTDSQEETTIETQEPEEIEEQKAPTPTKDPSLEKSFKNEDVYIDYNKCLNNNKNNYSKIEEKAYSGIKYSISNDRKIVNIKVNYYMISVIDKIDVFEGQVEGINSPIKSVLFSNYGQGGNHALFFLTETSDIYYLGLYSINQKDVDEKKVTATKINDNYSGIVGLGNVDANPKGKNSVGGYRAVVAVKKDGSFYDITP